MVVVVMCARQCCAFSRMTMVQRLWLPPILVSIRVGIPVALLSIFSRPALPLAQNPTATCNGDIDYANDNSDNTVSNHRPRGNRLGPNVACAIKTQATIDDSQEDKKAPKPSMKMPKDCSFSKFAMSYMLDEAKRGLEKQQTAHNNVAYDLVVSVVFIDPDPKYDSKNDPNDQQGDRQNLNRCMS